MEKHGILYIRMWLCGKTLMKLGTLSPSILIAFFTSRRGLPSPSRSGPLNSRRSSTPMPNTVASSPPVVLTLNCLENSNCLLWDSGPVKQCWFSGPTPLFSSRPTTRLKSQQAPKGEVESMTLEECTTLPMSYLSFLIHTHRNPGDTCGNGY